MIKSSDFVHLTDEYHVLTSSSAQEQQVGFHRTNVSTATSVWRVTKFKDSNLSINILLSWLFDS